MKFYVISFLVLIGILSGNSLPFPISTSAPPIESYSKSIEFNFTLPNNEVLKINISFVMLKTSEVLQNRDIEFDYDDYELHDYINVTPTNTTTTTTEESLSSTSSTPSSLLADDKIKPIITVDDAIEAFRKELITKEWNIGGYIESKNSFYRHFNLQYENVEIPIRCTYQSIFKKQYLKISCFEYREIEQERILSNGEIEKVRVEDLSQQLQHIKITNVKNYTQTYKMTIE